MTKTTTKKSVAVKSNRGRAQFAFVKATKKEIPTGIMSVVFKAVQKKRRGSVVEIAQAAIALGLKKVTSQNPVTQTHVMLNRLRKFGVTKRIAA